MPSSKNLTRDLQNTILHQKLKEITDSATQHNIVHISHRENNLKAQLGKTLLSKTNKFPPSKNAEDPATASQLGVNPPQQQSSDRTIAFREPVFLWENFQSDMKPTRLLSFCIQSIKVIVVSQWLNLLILLVLLKKKVWSIVSSLFKHLVRSLFVQVNNQFIKRNSRIWSSGCCLLALVQMLSLQQKLTLGEKSNKLTDRKKAMNNQNLRTWSNGQNRLWPGCNL